VFEMSTTGDGGHGKGRPSPGDPRPLAQAVNPAPTARHSVVKRAIMRPFACTSVGGTTGPRHRPKNRTKAVSFTSLPGAERISDNYRVPACVSGTPILPTHSRTSCGNATCSGWTGSSMRRRPSGLLRSRPHLRPLSPIRMRSGEAYGCCPARGLAVRSAIGTRICRRAVPAPALPKEELENASSRLNRSCCWPVWLERRVGRESGLRVRVFRCSC
jgi:hypothetical protein